MKEKAGTYQIINHIEPGTPRCAKDKQNTSLLFIMFFLWEAMSNARDHEATSPVEGHELAVRLAGLQLSFRCAKHSKALQQMILLEAFEGLHYAWGQNISWKAQVICHYGPVLETLFLSPPCKPAISPVYHRLHGKAALKPKGIAQAVRNEGTY